MKLSILADLAGDITISEEHKERILKNCKRIEKADGKGKSSCLFSYAQNVPGSMAEEKNVANAYIPSLTVMRNKL